MNAAPSPLPNLDKTAQLSYISDLELGLKNAQLHEFDASKSYQNNTHIVVGEPEQAHLAANTRVTASFSTSASTLISDKDEEQAALELPQKKYGRVYRNLRWTIFSVYRRLNFLVVLPNVVAIIFLAAQGRLLTASTKYLATAAAVNITVAVLMRQELVINLLFIIFGMCPQWMPLRIRRLAAKIYHLGGVHSGAGIAATLWFIVLNISLFHTLEKQPFSNFKAIVATLTIVLDLLLVGIVGFSHPTLRAKYHNLWEAIHRFAGWTAIGLFWIHFVVTANAQREVENPDRTLSQVLVQDPVFWLLIVTSISLIMPWLRLRKVKVHPEPLSKHAIRLHFTYTDLPLCAAPRLSDSPMKEWHAFAGIPEENGRGFSVIVSRAGDWTSRMIQSPPTELWVRGIPVRGVLHIAPIFKKMVIVATGSGIGPVLSLLAARNVDCRILWSTPRPETTYQQSIIRQVLTADPNAVIINTSTSGRPDLVRETYRLYTISGAEAVFIISNPTVTRGLVYALESRGVPAFAPIFDS